MNGNDPVKLSRGTFARPCGNGISCLYLVRYDRAGRTTNVRSLNSSVAILRSSERVSGTTGPRAIGDYTSINVSLYLFN